MHLEITLVATLVVWSSRCWMRDDERKKPPALKTTGKLKTLHDNLSTNQVALYASIENVLEITRKNGHVSWRMQGPAAPQSLLSVRSTTGKKRRFLNTPGDQRSLSPEGAACIILAICH